jgi:hypothetical protein
MRYALIFALAFLVFATAACSSKPKPVGDGPQPIGGKGAPQPGAWSKYIQVMSERERLEFHAIIDDEDRRTWVARNGIDVRAELAERLSRGISVEAAKRRITDTLEHEDKRGLDTSLFYSRYNTESRTKYYLNFRSDQLVSWNTYTLAQQDRTLALVKFVVELLRKFDAYLERGMGPETIRSLGSRSKKHLDDVNLINREALSNPDYKGAVEVKSEVGPDGKPRNVASRGGTRESRFNKPDFKNYLVAEQVLLAESKAEMLAWFDRDPDRKIVHRPFETHQFFLQYKPVRGKAEVVTVEFVYREGLLEDWFVYHEE